MYRLHSTAARGFYSEEAMALALHAVNSVERRAGLVSRGFRGSKQLAVRCRTVITNNTLSDTISLS